MVKEPASMVRKRLQQDMTQSPFVGVGDFRFFHCRNQHAGRIVS
jgi:hypothetical protein